jgi:outer membrane protein, heavy metal efflux system
MRSHLITVLVSMLLVLTGCEKYNAKPLNTGRQILASPVDGVPSTENQPITFVRAAELMRVHSPDLKEVGAEYQAKLALAQVKTPLPNPAFEAGPNYAFGPDVSNLYRLQPFASIGFSIPTGKRLKRQDELNRANADLAYAEAAIRYRELYLQLRETYSEFTLAQRRIELRRSISASAGQSSTVSRKMIEAGIASALDVGLIELEQVRLQTEELTARSSLQQAKTQFAALLGISTFHLQPPPQDAIGVLPTALPELSELKQVLLNNHPELARIRAKYEVSERALHLEIARQYPDFHIGPNFMRETGEKKTSLGLTLGIELPLFDRNQQGVATAKGDRDAVRIRYEVAANRALTELERAYQDYLFAMEKLKLLTEKVLPKAQSNIETARKSLEAGMTDALKFLETERGQRAVQLEALETELSLRRAWVDLEKAVGYPLQLFPGESVQSQPSAIQGANSNPSNSKEKN